MEEALQGSKSSGAREGERLVTTERKGDTG